MGKQPDGNVLHSQAADIVLQVRRAPMGGDPGAASYAAVVQQVAYRLHEDNPSRDKRQAGNDLDITGARTLAERLVSGLPPVDPRTLPIHPPGAGGRDLHPADNAHELQTPGASGSALAPLETGIPDFPDIPDIETPRSETVEFPVDEPVLEPAEDRQQAHREERAARGNTKTTRIRFGEGTKVGRAVRGALHGEADKIATLIRRRRDDDELPEVLVRVYDNGRFGLRGTTVKVSRPKTELVRHVLVDRVTEKLQLAGIGARRAEALAKTVIVTPSSDDDTRGETALRGQAEIVITDDGEPLTDAGETGSGEIGSAEIGSGEIGTEESKRTETVQFQQGKHIFAGHSEQKKIEALAERVAAALAVGGPEPVNIHIEAVGEGPKALALSRERAGNLREALSWRVRKRLVAQGFSVREATESVDQAITAVGSGRGGRGSGRGTITVSGLVPAVKPETSRGETTSRGDRVERFAFGKGRNVFDGRSPLNDLDRLAKDLTGQIAAGETPVARVHAFGGDRAVGPAKARQLAERRAVRTYEALRWRLEARLRLAVPDQDVTALVDQTLRIAQQSDTVEHDHRKQVMVVVQRSGAEPAASQPAAETRTATVRFDPGTARLADPAALRKAVVELADAVQQRHVAGEALPTVSIRAFGNGIADNPASADTLSTKRAKALRGTLGRELEAELRRRGVQQPDLVAGRVVSRDALGLGQDVGNLVTDVPGERDRRRFGLITVTLPEDSTTRVRDQWYQRFGTDQELLAAETDRAELHRRADEILGEFTPRPGVPADIRSSARETVALLLRDDKEPDAHQIATEIRRVFGRPGRAPVDDPRTPAVNLLDEVRANRVHPVDSLDGSALRDAIATLLDAGSRQRERVDLEYSDANLSSHFGTHVDGGHRARLGAGPRTLVPEVTVEVVAVGPHRGEGEWHTADQEAELPRQAFRSHAEATPDRGPAEISVRVPTAWGMLLGKFGGVFNRATRGSSTDATNSGSTRVVLRDVPSVTTGHDVTYRLTVRQAGRTPRHAVVGIPAKLRWEAASDSVPFAGGKDTHSLEAGAFTELGAVHDEIRRQVGRSGRRFDRTDVEVRAWLDNLGGELPHLLTGGVVRRTFAFGRRGRKREVVIGLTDTGDSSTATTADGAVERTQRDERKLGGDVAVSRGFSAKVKVMGGTSLFGVGVSLGRSRTVTDQVDRVETSSVHRRETVAGRIERHLSTVHLDVRVVQPGTDRGDVAVAVPVTAHTWLRRKQPGEHRTRSGRALAAVATSERARAAVRSMPDRLDAKFLLPETTAKALSQRVVRRLRERHLIKPADVGRAESELRSFLQRRARDVTWGHDRVRFPLSEIDSAYPDLLLEGVLDRRDPKFHGRVPRADVTTTLSEQRDVKVGQSGSTETTVGVTGYVVSLPAIVFADAELSRGVDKSDTRPTNVTRNQRISGPTGGTEDLWSFPFLLDVQAANNTTGRSLVSLGGEVGVQADRARAELEVAGDPTEGKFPAWSKNPLPDHGRPGYLPQDYEISQLRPVPWLATTMVEMMRGRRFRLDGVTRPFAGRKRRDVDSSDLVLKAVENFAAGAARLTRFGRAATLGDRTDRVVGPQSHGLFTSRQQVVEANLQVKLTNPRVVTYDSARLFESGTSLHSEDRHRRGTATTGKLAFEGGVLGRPNSQLLLAGVGEGELAIRRARSASTAWTGGVTEKRTVTKPAYLVTYDAKYVLGTSTDALPGPGRRELAMTRAVSLWVPADQIGVIGELTDSDLDLLTDDDRTRYEEHVAEAALRAEDDEAQSEEDAEDMTAAEPGAAGAQPVTADREHRDPAPRAPDTVGHGVGTVDIAEPAVVVRIAQHMRAALQEFARTQAGHQVPSQVEQAIRRQLGLDPRPGPGWPGRHFARLADDMAGEIDNAAVANRFRPVLTAMLNGGWPVYLPGETSIGRVEQTVVLSATLGEGSYIDTVDAPGGETELSRGAEWQDETTFTLESALLGGGAAIPGTKREAAGLLVAEAGGAGEITWNTHTGGAVSARITVPPATGPRDRFAHTLTVHLDVHPYAALRGHDRLAGLDPARVWTAKPMSFAGAVISEVPVGESVPVGSPLPPPVATVEGSLAARRTRVGLPPGLSPDTSVVARPFTAPALRSALQELSGAAPAAGPAAKNRPRLPALTHFSLTAATGWPSLTDHFGAALRPDGYGISFENGPLSEVRLHADVLSAELLGELDPVVGATTHTAAITDGREAGGKLVTVGAVDIRVPNLPGTVLRPVAGVPTGILPIAGAESSRADGHTTVEQAPEEQSRRRFLVRVVPNWGIVPRYRAKALNAAWSTPMETGPDQPVLIEVDETGLRELGLTQDESAGGPEHVPAEAGFAPAGTDVSEHGFDLKSVPRYLRDSEAMGAAAQVGLLTGDPAGLAVRRLLHPRLTGTGEPGTRRLRRTVRVVGLDRVTEDGGSVDHFLGGGRRFAITVDGRPYELVVRAEFDWAQAEGASGTRVAVPVRFEVSVLGADGGPATELLREPDTTRIDETRPVVLELPTVDSSRDDDLGEPVTAEPARHFTVEAVVSGSLEPGGYFG
ncbi:MAG: hypothetical protein ABW215_00090, partial [Kibdelosporangium sp.]